MTSNLAYSTCKAVSRDVLITCLKKREGECEEAWTLLEIMALFGQASTGIIISSIKLEAGLMLESMVKTLHMMSCT